MALMQTPPAEIGWEAADFNLKGVDGKNYTLENSRGTNGLVVMFICNHCPYVQKVMDKIVSTTAELKTHGINSIAIMSNDVKQYPEDGLQPMKLLSMQKNFSFPYVIDETQDIARAYDAVCTPEFYGFDSELKLQYRGRIDELQEAMLEVAESGKVSGKQFNSMGCNIKWAA